MARNRNTDARRSTTGGMSRRRFVALTGAGAALAASTPFVPKKVFAAKTVTVKLTLGWLPQGTSSWTYASLPFWEKEGIEVLIEKGSGSALAVQQIGQGQYEFGIPAAPNAIQQAIKGLPLVSLATVSYDTSMGLVVLADSAIKTPKDLAGKTVGSTLTSGEYPFLPTFYKNVGVDPGTIKSVAVDNKVRERSLLDGLVDAISAFGTSAVPKILAAGKTPKVFLYSKFGLPFYGNSLTTSPAYFAKEKALCEAVTVGLCEGVKSTLLAPAKTIDKMFDEVPEFRMSSTAREQADVGLGLWAALSTVPEATGHAIGYADPATYAKMTDIIYDASAGAGDTKPDASTLLTNAFIGGVKLTAAEWAQVKETFGTYAAIMS
jgi:ABC-type nitrate/sulfonate/bicarbonate transport system substrate-binding protein